MTIARTTILVTALGVAASATALAQAPITKSASVSATATIQAIDSTARIITLRDEKGMEDTFAVGPEVKRFNELKVGDTVKMTYYESLVLQIRKPGEKPGATSVEAGLNRAKGATPGGSLGVQDKMTVTVKAIDPAVPSVTVTTPDGRTVTRKIENKKYLEGVTVGSLIDITYTRAVLTSVVHAK
jgi:hypothetical protein